MKECPSNVRVTTERFASAGIPHVTTLMSFHVPTSSLLFGRIAAEADTKATKNKKARRSFILDRRAQRRACKDWHAAQLQFRHSLVASLLQFSLDASLMKEATGVLTVDQGKAQGVGVLRQMRASFPLETIERSRAEKPFKAFFSFLARWYSQCDGWLVRFIILNHTTNLPSGGGSHRYYPRPVHLFQPGSLRGWGTLPRYRLLAQALLCASLCRPKDNHIQICI